MGQDQWEELNVLPAAADGSPGPSTNFGWPGKEGLHDNNGGQGSCPSAPAADGSAMDPIHEYGRPGKSITGGFVYRGAAIPEMQGRYIFADYDTNNIYEITWDGTEACDYNNISDEFDGMGVLNGITSFSEDASGELIVVTVGGVYRVEPM